MRERKPYTAMRRVPRSQEFTCALGQALPWVEEGISSLIHSTGWDGPPSLCRELFCMLEVETPVPLRASLFWQFAEKADVKWMVTDRVGDTEVDAQPARECSGLERGKLQKWESEQIPKIGRKWICEWLLSVSIHPCEQEDTRSQAHTLWTSSLNQMLLGKSQPVLSHQW